MVKRGKKKQNPEVNIIIRDKTKKSRRAKSSPTPRKTFNDLRVEKVLVENFISLQQVMTTLSIKFDNLSEQISKLLQLFEISAKALAEKDFNTERGNLNSEKIAKQMDSLLEQNKVIARGMTLINDKILERNVNSPIPLRQMNPNQEMQNADMQGYQKSISSNQGNFPPRQIR